MAVNEGLRMTAQAIVVNTLPDWCWTPLGPLMVPIPYNISAKLDVSIALSPNVRMTGVPVFTIDSRLTEVIGDEQGIGGGIISGVNCGHCRPMTYSETVRASKQFVVTHDARFWMNCNGPDGPANTVGRAIFVQIVNLRTMMKDNDALAENYPYSAATFRKIEAIRDDILKFSKRYNVSPVAVAGAIADEYNSQGLIDWLQNGIVGNLPDLFIRGDLIFYFDAKLLNAFKNDLGSGNIKLETAWFSLYQRDPTAFPGVTDYASMVDYILSDSGTAHLAAMYIAEAEQTYGALLRQLPPDLQEAVLVTAYKRGIENYDLQKALAENKPFKPGEGIRTMAQRKQLLRALGLLEAEKTDGVRVAKPSS